MWIHFRQMCRHEGPLDIIIYNIIYIKMQLTACTHSAHFLLVDVVLRSAIHILRRLHVPIRAHAQPVGN